MDRPDPPAGPEFPLMRVIHGLVGESDAMMAVYRKVAVYGPAEAHVLVTGETGTGKELVARALHGSSPRQNRPFVALNCSALNDELFESELFGHERGAFTGAVSAHRGRFERADGGTLFLDEIGDMPLRAQSKLLRVLEHGTYDRVGGEKELHVDVRVVAATNVPLERAVGEGGFRADLYHRVAVLRVHIPALRERDGDIALLVEHFLRHFNQRYRRTVKRLSPEAVRVLEQYHWPGNVRELRNVLERVYVETQGDVIGRSAFTEWEREREFLAAGQWNAHLLDERRLGGAPILIPPARPGEAAPSAYRIPYPLAEAPRLLDVDARVRTAGQPAELTEEAIREAAAAARGNLTGAARRLGVHKTTLYRAMKRLGLERSDLAPERP